MDAAYHNGRPRSPHRVSVGIRTQTQMNHCAGISGRVAKNRTSIDTCVKGTRLVWTGERVRPQA